MRISGSQRVVYTPSPSELIHMINACAKDMTTMLDVVQRLKGLVEMEVRKDILDLEPDNATLQREYEKVRSAFEASAAADTGKSMSKAISNDEDVTKVMIAITAGMSASGSQMPRTWGTGASTSTSGSTTRTRSSSASRATVRAATRS